MVVCPMCKREVQPGEQWCPYCGGALVQMTSPQVPPVVSPVTSPVGPPSAPAPQMPVARICPNCKADAPPNARFCDKCGAQLPPLGPGLSMAPAAIPKAGCLVLPDGAEIQITQAPRSVGREHLEKFVSEKDGLTISRRHMTVHQEADKFYVEDGKTSVQEKRSTNSTWLVRAGKEEEIADKGKRELQDGDEIDVARLVRLRFKTK